MNENAEALRAHRLLFETQKARFLKKYKSLVSGSPRIEAGLENKLCETLFDSLRGVLTLIIETDLALLAKSRFLYYDLQATDTLPEPIKALYDRLGNRAGFDSAGSSETELSLARDHLTAFKRYCDLVLTPLSRPGGIIQFFKSISNPPPADGIPALFLRHPHARWVLEKVTDNYVANLAECLKRVRADRKAIESCFLDGEKINSISNILVTKSDPHKGGKRVIILTFSYGSAKKKRRVVYKPSDVEMDYRIAGKNTDAVISLLSQKEKTKERNGFPAPPYQSLFELCEAPATQMFAEINETAARVVASQAGEDDSEAYKSAYQTTMKQLAMPTYVILPRNPGSRLKENNDNIPIRNSYGYLEYLSHEPENPPYSQPITRFVDNLLVTRGHIDKEWDWITDNPEELHAAFRLWGRLIVLAALFLQTDLHFENQRVHKRKPFIIDLENCLVKRADTPADTLIIVNNNYVRQAHPIDFKDPLISPRPYRISMSEKEWIPIEIDYSRLESPEAYTVSQNYYYNGQHVQHASLNLDLEAPHSEASFHIDLVKGISETLGTVRNQRAVVQKWVQEVGIEKCVVRHVLRKTELFAGDIRSFQSRLISSTEEITATPQQILSEFVESIRPRVKFETQATTPKAHELEHLDWNGLDYINLDVPAHYRRVNSKDLITSTGKLFKGFYQKTGKDLLEESFGTKLPGDKKAFQKQLELFTDFVSVPLS